MRDRHWLPPFAVPSASWRLALWDGRSSAADPVRRWISPARLSFRMTTEKPGSPTTSLTFRPFTHNGKQAYLAAVFRCGNGKPFVAYLEKYSAAQLAQLADLQKTAAERAPNRPPPKWLPNTVPLDVKKPGDAEWIAASSAGTTSMPRHIRRRRALVCPDGSANAIQVQPYDSDAQLVPMRTSAAEASGLIPNIQIKPGASSGQGRAAFSKVQ